MSVNTTIGIPARGDKYFDRPALTRKLWDKISAGSNILIAAPRRVGKTTLMYHFLDNPPQDTRFIYLTTESVNNENEFFRRLFNHVVSNLEGVARYTKKVKSSVQNLVGSIKSVGLNGISMESGRTNFNVKFLEMITSLNPKNERLVVMLDEFAETVQNIIRDENKSNAIHFLQIMREVRLDPALLNKVQFIFAGSIGLENVVENIDAAQTIADLDPVPVPPLDIKEANDLIRQILDGSGYEFPAELIEYMLDKIEWLIPFYIQVIIDEIDKLDFPGDGKKISKEHVDEAISRAIRHRNYFGYWHTRLRRNYSGEEYNFAKKLLNYISDNGKATSDEINNIAASCNLEDGYGNIINALKHDGYINNYDNPKVYRFNSPLLKIWWNENVAN